MIIGLTALFLCGNILFKWVVGGSRQETLNPGFVLLRTRQQRVPVILRELVLPDGFDLVSPSFTVRDVTTELSEPRPTRKIIQTF
ncbi:unnamed protein product [Schistosoma curassoni]|uniref:PHB domain-containing protein n=1 Tax=Schistosoma curassoni TaxID=6186 RepID=A0A183KEH7_9TREM|nr:unnamed protein product [Schistosoma curassoni]